MGLLDRFIEKRLENAKASITKEVVSELTTHVDSSLEKANSSNPFMMTPLGGSGAKRYSFMQDGVNGNIQRKNKPGTGISYETLRAFSINHEISRAAINYRKRQMSGLEWDIVNAEDDDTGDYTTEKAQLKAFFKTLGGRGVGYRRFIDKFVEDLMVLDAVALEKQRVRKGSLFTLIPIDAATIRLRVDESGATPEPPETAYVQVIRGQVTAEWTDDEMLYEMLNPRNDSPYGLAPLESLIVTVTSSLRAGMYNLGYLTDTNLPEGLFTLPDGWQPQQIKEFQEYFDSLMAGNSEQISRLKFMPNGTYTPTNKPTDMAFNEFNDWLMKITCAIFEVPPNELGFAPKGGLGGKGFSEQQQDNADNKGQLPLANLIMEVFTKVIQEDLGFPTLKFDFTGLQQKNERAEAELNEILIRSGQRTIDELRTNDGLDALPGGVGERPFVLGTVAYLETQEQSDAREQQQRDAQQAAAEAANQSDAKDDKPAAKDDEAAKLDNALTLRKQQLDELKTFRKYAVNRVKANKAVRPFVSTVLPLDMVEELNKGIAEAADVVAVRQAFTEPMQELELLSVDAALEARNRVLTLV